MAIKNYKIFVSYDRENDQKYRDEFEKTITNSEITSVKSALVKDIDINADAYKKNQKIREDCLQDSVVTVVLVGKDTWKKRYVDLEIAAGLSKTESYAPSGLIGILLPDQSDLGDNRYAYDTIPQRLYKNIQNGYAKMYPWDMNLLVVSGAVYEASERKNTVVPDNSLPLMAEDLKGEGWE